MGDEKIYKLVNKYIKGVNIEGYTIANVDGKRKFLKTDDIIKVAYDGKVENADVVIDTENSRYILDIKGGLSSIETVTKINNIMLTLQCRLVDKDNKCKGYKAQDESGKNYQLTINNTWELALGHAIVGVEAVCIQGHKILRSKDGFKLSDLPKIYIK